MNFQFTNLKNYTMKKIKVTRQSRILALGEGHGHAHIITGECELFEQEGVKYVKAGKNCAIKHLMEMPFVKEGQEIWTKEHADIDLKEGNTYEIGIQKEYNPYEDSIRNVQD
jgi:hypothetical protein